MEQKGLNMQNKKTLAKMGWLICSMGMVFYAYEFFLRIAPSVMEPDLRAFFGIGAAGFGTLVGIYYLIYTPMQLFVGPIVDYTGPRRILTFATLACAFGTLIFCLSHSTSVAGVGRFFVGFGSAFAFVGALKLASVWLPTNRFATFTGMVTGLGMVGGMVGDIGLTSMVQHLGWQHTLLIGVLLGIILAPIIYLIVRDNPKDVPPGTIKVSDLFKEFGKIAKNHQIWLAGFIACMLYLSLSAFAEIWGIPFLLSAGFTRHEAALVNSMVFFGWLIGSPLTGMISDRIKQRRLPLIVGSTLSALSIFLVLVNPLHSAWFVSILLFIFGLCCSVQNICFAIGYESSPAYVAGTAVAFVNMLTMLGGFIFQPLIGKLIDLAWSGQMQNGLRFYTLHDYRLALISLPVGMLISLLLTLFLRESYGANFKKLEKNANLQAKLH